MKNLMKLSILAILFLAFAACSDDDKNEDQTSRMMVHLTDAPGDYDAVYVDVQDVVIKYSDDDSEVSLGNINTGVYDLLELTGGLTLLLADEEVPSGNVTQMRLVLGDDNTVVVDGETFDLATPSAQQSGLKLNINQTLEAGILYEFILDFDVEESIVEQGNGGYLLKPVIRANTVAESGSISGEVLPTGFQTLVTASNGTETISTYTDTEGQFVLNGVPEGTYTVTIEPEVASGFSVLVLEDIVVVNGEVNALGTINLL